MNPNTTLHDAPFMGTTPKGRPSMKIRTALLAGTLALVASAASAIPTSAPLSTAEPEPATFAWSIAPSSVHVEPLPAAPGEEPIELAVFGPCGCTWPPRCPFPFPFPPTWPPGGPIFIPLPIPGTSSF